MTALETFLQSIITKKEKGFAHLVSTISDEQIKEALRREKEQMERPICQCPESESQTAVWCCNKCGKPTEDEWMG